jgi:hypothetical protein
MNSGVYAFTMCIRDDDEKIFDFMPAAEGACLLGSVGAAIEGGRKVRCYTLAADDAAQEREERFLVAKGYRRDRVLL